MLITPELSTQFVNKCFALAGATMPPYCNSDPRMSVLPAPGQRAWFDKKQRWVNVHAQISPFSYVSWLDTKTIAPTELDTWDDEAIESVILVSQSFATYRFVATIDLCWPSGQCEVLEWPHRHLQEDFELAPAYLAAAGKTSWEDSYNKARGYC